MNRRSHFWQRSLYLAGLLLGLAGCVSPRPSPSPAPTPLPPSPLPPTVLIHVRAGIDQPLPPPPAPETTSFIVETLPISPAELSPQERRLYFAPDTGLPVYEVRSFANPERKVPEKSYYLVLPEETRRALVPDNPKASEEEMLSAFRNADNEWVVLTVRAINGLFSHSYTNRIRDNALLIPTFDKDGKRILMVMQPDDGCNDLAERCDLSQSDIYTNRVQIFWFEEGDLRRAVVGFPKVHHWYNDELDPVANPIRYNPKDEKIYQLNIDRRFFQFSLFQDEEGQWRWRILPELTPYLVDERGVEDKRQEVIVEMEALGEETGFFGQGAWEEVERKTYPDLGNVETVVYRVFEDEKTGDEGKSGYLLVQAKAPSGDEFYFLIITNSQDRDIGPITTKYGQEKLVEYYARLVAYFPLEILERVYRSGNAVGILVTTYEEERRIAGYDFDSINPGSRNSAPVVLFTQLNKDIDGKPRDPQADFEQRLGNKKYKNDTLARFIVETFEMESYVTGNPKIAQNVEDLREFQIVTKDKYDLLMAIIKGQHWPQPVMPLDEALITVFDTNPMVNSLLRLTAACLALTNSASPPPDLINSILGLTINTLPHYTETLNLNFTPPFSPTP